MVFWDRRLRRRSPEIHADLVRELAAVVGGRGGGKPTLAQAGGPDAGKLDEALAAAPEQVRLQCQALEP